jgi:hypothetical protein
MKYAVLATMVVTAVAMADAPWTDNVKAADVANYINEGESCIAFHGDYVYCISNCNERGTYAVIPYGRSTDGGETWTTTWWVDSTGPSLWHSDPVLLTDDTGYVHMFIQFSAMLIRHYLSTDNGLTWTDTTDVSHQGSVDKPWACYYGNELYICWQDLGSGTRGIWFAKSTDGGRNWDRYRIDTRTYLTGICASPSGILYIALRTGGSLYAFKSTDAGATWPDSLKVRLDSQCTYSDGYGDRAPLTCIAAPTDTNVFVTLVDQRHGNWDILYSRSTDGGATWTPLAVLNDPTAGGQCKGWVEADVYGRLHFLWYHTPSWPTSASSWWSVRYRYSDDYGATFSPSIRLSDSTFRSPVTFMGEYHIMETDSQYIRAVWTDGREGDLDLWYAQAELSQIGVEENPFRTHRMPGVTLHVPGLLRTAAVPVELWLKRPGNARLSVFDATGRQLACRDLGRLDAGTHRVQLHDLPAGRTLFVKLTAGETATARTMRVR